VSVCWEWRVPPGGGSHLTANSAAPRRPIMGAMSPTRVSLLTVFLIATTTSARAQTLEGRWRLLTAQDIKANGEVGRLPWGAHPAGSIVVQAGACYVQIMSTDIPSFSADQPVRDQMKAALLSSYIAYSGACTYDEKEGKLSIKVDAGWRPDYVGTDQKRVFSFENGKLIFGPGPGTIRAGSEMLTRRLTLERVP
jgi:hypothetical protein